MNKQYLTLITSVLLAVTLQPTAAQSNLDGTPETPPTTRMRVENAQARFDKTIADITETFDRVAKEPQLISTKEVVDAIDKGDRALKNTRTASGLILTTLRAESKAIAAEAAFSEEQKSELQAAVESLVAKCEDLSSRSDIAIKHLATSYKAMGKWRAIYKTYRNLDGEAKARKQLEASVQDYVKGLTASPDAFEGQPATKAEGQTSE